MADESRLSTYRYLAEHPAIFSEIAETPGDELHVQKVLRSRYPDAAVRLALTVAELRRRAARKFPQADRMWFDRIRLEQATPWAVARHKAKRFEGAVWDGCCGLGADALALAQGSTVTAVDHDPLACLLTELNAEALGIDRSRLSVRCAPIESLSERNGWLHLDPDRRANAPRRTVRIEDFVPEIDVLKRLMTEFRGGAVKVSPASNFGGKFDDVEVEIVSLNGEAKEATLWFGALAEPDLWRATLLPGGQTLSGDPLSVAPELSPLGGYLYDPDPAIVRSGLIDLLCATAGLTRLDDAEEYLTSDAEIATPFAKPFRVIAELPNNERQLRKVLRQNRAAHLEIKTRRLPVDVERLQRSLPTGDGHPLVVIFARIAGKARIVIAERVAKE